MKKTKLIMAAALAIAGVGLFASSAKAALTYTPGDLFIGFHTTGTGSTFDYLVNIGPASTYRDATSSFTLSLNSVKLDLDGIFGANWSSRSDVMWGVFGATYTGSVSGDPAATLYAGQPASLGIGYFTSTSGAQAQASGRINSLGTNFKSNDTATANNAKGTIQTLPEANSYSSFQTNNNLTSFLYYSNALADFGNGTAGASLNLYRMTPTALGSEVAGTLEGTFSINSAGIISYTAPVPEPSTYGLMIAAGAVVLVAVRRARMKRNA